MKRFGNLPRKSVTIQRLHGRASFKNGAAASGRRQQPYKETLLPRLDAPHSWLNNFLQAVFWMESVKQGQFLGINIKRSRKGYTAVLSVKHYGVKYVGFVDGETFTDCLALVGYSLGARSIKWHKSKF